jgi:hypothetical protein
MPSACYTLQGIEGAPGFQLDSDGRTGMDATVT